LANLTGQYSFPEASQVFLKISDEISLYEPESHFDGSQTPKNQVLRGKPDFFLF